MVRDSTATETACQDSPRRRLPPSSASGLARLRRRATTLLSVVAALAAVISLTGVVDAGARIRDQDDFDLPSDLSDIRDFQQDNRVHPDHAPRESELLLVHVLLRHGDRTPDPPTYATDPYANFTYFPVGWGQLTAKGKRTEYAQGTFLRQRYGAFLGRYRDGLLSARTTDWPRTKDSMALVLAGLFPPDSQDTWDGGLGAMWTPIAAVTTPRDEDKLLYMWDVDCPAYTQEFQRVLKSPAFQKQFHGTNGLMIEYLEKHSGSKINVPEDVYNIYQALLAQQGFNLTLPAWTESVFPEKMAPLTALFFELDTYNRKMQRLRAGPLLKRIVRQSVAKSRGLLQPSRKMYLYAAHDNNVAALLRALNVWETSVPPYGVMVIAELRRVGGQVGMQLFLKNSTVPNELHALKMTGCDHFCPLHKFVHLTADVLPDNWDNECNAT